MNPEENQMPQLDGQEVTPVPEVVDMAPEGVESQEAAAEGAGEVVVADEAAVEVTATVGGDDVQAAAGEVEMVGDVVVPVVESVEASGVQPVAVPPTDGKKGGKKMMGLILAVIGVLLVGGVAAGVWVYNDRVLNSDARILGAAFENLLTAQEVSMTTKMTVEGDEADVTLDMNIEATRTSSFVSMDLAVDLGGVAFSGGAELLVRDSESWENPGDIYFKTRNVGSILNTVTGGVGLGGLEDLLDQWVVVREETLQEFQRELGQEENQMMQCVTDVLADFPNDRAMVGQMVEAFEEVDFLGMERQGTEDVRGRQAFRYDFRLNERTGRQLIEAMVGTDLVRALDDCTDGLFSDFELDVFDAGSATDDMTIRASIWIDRSSREVVRMDMRASDEDMRMTMTTEIRLGESDVPGAPGDAIDLEDYIMYLFEVGMDMMFGGMGLGLGGGMWDDDWDFGFGELTCRELFPDEWCYVIETYCDHDDIWDCAFDLGLFD